MAPNPKLQSAGPIDLFRPGTFMAMEGRTLSYSLSDLRAMADGYDPEGAPAPIVVGHPSTDAPAYGWVDRLDVQDGVLRGTIRDMVPAFAEAVRNGHYRKVSISLFPKDHPANPTPGVNYLRHVGFLGAAAPAVSGLKPVSLAAPEGTVAFSAEFDAAGFAANQAALEAAEIIAALRAEIAGLRAELDSLRPAPAPTEAPEFAAMRAEVERYRRDKLDRDLELLIQQGRLLPVLKAQVLDFACGLDAAETVSFASGAAVTPRDWFMDFLARQPQAVSFGSIIPTDGPMADDSRAFNHLPAGYTADPTNEPVYRRARQIETEKGISFAAAVTVAMAEAGLR